MIIDLKKKKKPLNQTRELHSTSQKTDSTLKECSAFMSKTTMFCQKRKEKKRKPNVLHRMCFSILRKTPLTQKKKIPKLRTTWNTIFIHRMRQCWFGIHMERKESEISFHLLNHPWTENCELNCQKLHDFVVFTCGLSWILFLFTLGFIIFQLMLQSKLIWNLFCLLVTSINRLFLWDIYAPRRTICHSLFSIVMVDAILTWLVKFCTFALLSRW